MNNELIINEFYHLIESKVFGDYKIKAYSHSIEVSTICMILAKKRGLDIEACQIMGLYHDISKYTSRVSKLHGTYSAQVLEELFKKYPHPLSQEICHAIRVHSNKDTVDDAYSECLKDADTYASYLEEVNQVLSQSREERVRKVENEI